MTTFTTQDRQDAQRTPSLLEQVRIKIMETAYWCADNADSESYNAVKVLCSDVLAMLQEVQRPPLTHEQIMDLAAQCKAPWHSHTIDPLWFARAIERAHGIGE